MNYYCVYRQRQDRPGPFWRRRTVTTRTPDIVATDDRRAALDAAIAMPYWANERVVVHSDDEGRIYIERGRLWSTDAE